MFDLSHCIFTWTAIQDEENLFGGWISRLGPAGLSAFALLLATLIAAIALFFSRRSKAKPFADTVAVTRFVISGRQFATSPSAASLPAAPIPQQAFALPENFGSLYVNNGPLRGSRFPVPKNGLLIGRDPALCSIVLPDDTVSKEHAWVLPLESGVAVIDRSSLNGTYLNSTDSQRISKIILNNNDRIFIGRKNPTEITYFCA